MNLKKAWKRLGRGFTEHGVSNLKDYITSGGSVLSQLDLIARETSAKFVYSKLSSAEIHLEREDLYRYIEAEFPKLPPGLFLEFGVWKGGTINRWARNLPSVAVGGKIFGFDSFKGLRNSWSYPGLGKGAFNLSGKKPANIDAPNVQIIEGWIEETLLPFLNTHNYQATFIHFDLDVYEPTKYALDLLSSRLNRGCLILFDELIGFPGWEFGEFKALNETLPDNKFEYVAFTNRQALIKIL